MSHPDTGSLAAYCRNPVHTIEDMVARGQLVYNPAVDRIEIGSWPAKGHPHRKSLIKDHRYVAVRARMLSITRCGCWGAEIADGN